jgi:hypothetical protein
MRELAMSYRTTSGKEEEEKREGGAEEDGTNVELHFHLELLHLADVVHIYDSDLQAKAGRGKDKSASSSTERKGFTFCAAVRRARFRTIYALHCSGLGRSAKKDNT